MCDQEASTLIIRKEKGVLNSVGQERRRSWHQQCRVDRRSSANFTFRVKPPTHSRHFTRLPALSQYQKHQSFSALAIFSRPSPSPLASSSLPFAHMRKCTIHIRNAFISFTYSDRLRNCFNQGLGAEVNRTHDTNTCYKCQIIISRIEILVIEKGAREGRKVDDDMLQRRLLNDGWDGGWVFRREVSGALLSITKYSPFRR